jgi:membrane fusion protein (multidrug efflux system)
VISDEKIRRTAWILKQGLKMRSTGILCTSTVLIGLLLQACTPKEPAKIGQEAIEVGVVTVTTGSVTTVADLTGRTTPTLIADVRPRVDGVVQSRRFKEGSVVHAGDILYQIDPSMYQAALDQTTAQLESTRANLTAVEAKEARYKKLAATEVISKQDVDDITASALQAKANVHQSLAQQEAAQINFAYTRIVAPITGRIGRSTVTPGALVTANQQIPLATIQQLDPIYVDMTQSSQQLLQLRRALSKGTVAPANAAVRLRFEDGTSYPQLGTVEFAEITVAEDTGTVTLRAKFPNPDGFLLPGMFVRVEVPQSVLKDAIVIPQQGIVRGAKGDATAFVVSPDNKVEERSVVATQAIRDKWLVTSGLQAGDRLIVEGTSKVKAGSMVKPVAVTLP